jgi:hypothetical protein
MTHYIYTTSWWPRTILQNFKISFYVNLHAVSCSESKRGSTSVSVCAIVWRDDESETTMKGSDGSGWSSDSVVFWLGRRQNRDTIEWLGEWPMLRWPFYNSGWWMLGYLRRVPGDGGANSMLWFRFERGQVEAMGWSVDGRWSEGNELILALWDGSVTWRGGVIMLATGEAASGRGKRGDNAS